MLKKILKSAFHVLGLEIRKKQAKKAPLVHQPTPVVDHLQDLRAALSRIKNRGLLPGTVVDVGAAEGLWTKAAMDIWPHAHYLLMEPLKERKEVLIQLEKKYSTLHVVNAAAGDQKGEINFFVAEDLDGSGIASNGTGSNYRTVNVTTIDDEVRKYNLPGPYVIKLDTHGFEIPILNGAIETLAKAELIIIECYGFQIAPNSLLFWEMCQFMDSKGFRFIDIIDIMRREKDEAFWQCDAFFIPKHNPVFNKNTYN